MLYFRSVAWAGRQQLHQSNSGFCGHISFTVSRCVSFITFFVMLRVKCLLYRLFLSPPVLLSDACELVVIFYTWNFLVYSAVSFTPSLVLQNFQSSFNTKISFNKIGLMNVLRDHRFQCCAVKMKLQHAPVNSKLGEGLLKA